MSAGTGVRPIDCDVHNAVPRIEDLHPYLPQRWSDYLVEHGVTSLEPNYYPRGLPISAQPRARLDSAAPPGSDPAVAVAQALDATEAEYAILNCLYGIQLIHNEDWAAAMATALNRWQVERWLDHDPRLRASIVVPTQSSARAAEEVERWAGHPGFVQVLLLVRASAPYGKRHYWPLLEAAQRHDLPIGIHAGGTATNPITPVGWPSHYVEDYASAAQAFQAQVTSLVCEGVFAKFPRLRVVLIESGVTWLPSLVWRLDKNWKGLRREIPWVNEAPSAVVRKHFRLTAQPFDAPDPAHPDAGTQVRKIMEHLGSYDMLLYSSDYPHWHAHTASDSLVRHLDPEAQRKVLRDNSLATYDLT